MKDNYHTFNHGSLFSGIGGFDLAASWMGWNNVFHSEINPFCQKILKYYWPDSITYGNIIETDFTIHRGRIDILSGGFPCQPYSIAGKRKGKADDRHLWPQMLRAIREIQPRYVVGENVRGLINWNGGMVFDEVQTDLETEGYQVTPFLLPACAVNAPHRRDRIWFVAHSAGDGHEHGRSGQNRFETGESENDSQKRERIRKNIIGTSKPGTITDTKSGRSGGISQQIEQTGPQKSGEPFRSIHTIFNATHTNGLGLWGKSDRIRKSGFLSEKSSEYDWTNFPTESPICDGNDGISSQLDGITFSKWRNESIKGGGNAIVPQVALQIFRAIEQMESTHK